jgi:hypothetical protein
MNKPGRSTFSFRARRCGRWVMLLALVACSVASWAEEEGYKLTPKKIEDIASGKAAIVRGEVGKDGDKFYVEYLSMLQPVSVVLMAADPAKPLKLNLSKYRYDQSDRSGDTGSEGAVSFNFRTQGELKIHVTPKSDPGTDKLKYFLVAWVGDEFKPDLRPPVVLAEPTGGGGLPWGMMGIGLLVVIGAGAFFYLGRRSA